MEPFVPQVNEIAANIYRISTLIPDVTPDGFTFNQFLVNADQPLLFHTGPRQLFPLVSGAVATVMPLESLRWISFGHVESDECGSVNEWLAAAPDSQVVFGALGCDVSLNDMCNRPPVVLEADVLHLGGQQVRQISTPHVPHGWEAQVLYEESTKTLFCGDLFTQVGAPAPVTSDDLLESALVAERMFRPSTLAPHTGATIRGLGDLGAETLAIMHGSSFHGDCRAALYALADAYDSLAAEAGDH